MRFAAPSISHHRLSRFQHWAMLWLTWFAAFLDAAAAFAPLSRQAETIAHAWLDQIERVVVNIAIIRASQRVRRPIPPKGQPEHKRNDASLHRAIIGASLRRALRACDLRTRLAALRQDIGTLIAHLIRRLPRGLTRRRPILAKRESAHIDETNALRSCALADTS